MSELDRQLSAWVAQHALPGAVAGISRRRPREAAAAGVADKRTGRPMSCDTAVRIASVTKPVTAAAAVLAGRAQMAGRAAGPSGGLWSTAADLLSFAEFVLADAQLLAAMRAASTGTAAPVPYGLGWALAPGLMFHKGRLDGFRSILLVAPEHQYCAVMVVNSTDALPAIAGFLDGPQARLTGMPASARLMF